MANGYCPALLRHIIDVANGNAPGNKMNIAGYLAMLFCCQNSTVNPINDGYTADSHTRPLTVTYRKRATRAVVQDEDTCEIGDIPVREEWTLPSLNYAQVSFFIEDEEIQKYCADASQMRTLGPTQVMQEHYDNYVNYANALLSEINFQLVTMQSTQFGGNVTTGGDTGKVINISRDGDKFILDNGFIDIMRDLEENEFCGEPCIVGGGLFAAYNRALAMACCNSAGMDLSKMNIPRFFFDKDTQTVWGEDSIGVFAPGSVKFIGRNRYGGNFSGYKGNSYFFTAAFPVNDFNCNNDSCINDLILDVQLKYYDCPDTRDVDGVATPLGRGWQVIVSKYFALWVQPTDGYADDDPLDGTNGTLLYYIQNEATDDPSYAYAG